MRVRYVALGRSLEKEAFKLRHLSRLNIRKNGDPPKSRTRISVQSLVAKYIQSLHSETPPYRRLPGHTGTGHENGVLSEAELAFLQHRGYSRTDVKQWASILLSRRPFFAIRQLSKLQHVEKRRFGRDAPVFLALFLLRRPRISANTMESLLIHIWERSDLMLPDSNTSNEMQRRNAPLEHRPNGFKIISYLIQHALKIWPAALINITALAIKILESEPASCLVAPGAKLSDEQVAYLSKSCNRILLQLSHPAAIDKYKATTFQQRAQFDLLRHMAEHKPPLTVTQDGYRSVVRVQLARAKTPQERDWANLKSKTWPPWKKDKTGLDAEKGPEYSMTRAAMAIIRMQEAGYATTTWEDVAKIYSGWDTDGTPTIQHRFLMRPPPGVMKRLDPSEEKRLQAQMWAARIRATRTVREAWACFLSCRNKKMSQRHVIYASMLEKLVYEEQRQLDIRRRPHGAAPAASGELYNHASTSEVALPGDGKEVHPPPVSPLESMYLASEPPSVDLFFDEMVQNHIIVPDTCLALVMDNASCLQRALSYLLRTRQGSLYRPLLNFFQGRFSKQRLSGLVFTSLIRAYCRFGNITNQRPYDTSSGNRTLFHVVEGLALYRPQSFLYALHLLYTLKLRHRPAWNAVLESLQGEKRFALFKTYEPGLGAIINRILPFFIARQLCVSMQRIGLGLDTMAFHSLCVITERAVVASYRIKALEEDAQSRTLENKTSLPSRTLQLADEIIAQGSTYLQTTFESFTTGMKTTSDTSQSSSTSRSLGLYALDEIDGNSVVNLRSETPHNALSPSLPRLLNTPSPAALHAFVRALGYARDFHALCKLTHWMVDHKPELDIQVDEARNGRRMLRQTFTALAFFVNEVEELASECRELVENVGEEWGGWPSDQEIQAYFREGSSR